MQVLLVDQQNINRFSRLNSRPKELDIEIEQMKARISMYIGEFFLIRTGFEPARMH